MLSIVLLTYNRPDLLPEAIASIDSQHISVPFEKVLVMNGSPFNPPIAPDWKIHRIPKNIGNIGGQNEAIDYAWYDWVLFVSDDVRLIGNSCVDTLLAHRSGYAQVMPTILNADSSIQSVGADFVWPGLGINRRRWRGKETDYIPSICYLLRKNCWRDAEGFDTDLPMAGEDVDMGLKLRNIYGWDCLGVVETAYATHLANSTLQYSRDSRWRFRQAREMVVRKNYMGLNRTLRLAAMQALASIS